MLNYCFECRYTYFKPVDINSNFTLQRLDLFVFFLNCSILCTWNVFICGTAGASWHTMANHPLPSQSEEFFCWGILFFALNVFNSSLLVLWFFSFFYVPFYPAELNSKTSRVYIKKDQRGKRASRKYGVIICLRCVAWEEKECGDPWLSKHGYLKV